MKSINLLCASCVVLYCSAANADDNLQFSGYVQPQAIFQLNNQAASANSSGLAPNDVMTKSDGTTTNNDYFRLRRARLKATYNLNDAGRLVLEVEPLPGITTVARQVEAVGTAHWDSDMSTDFAMGLFKVPFGYEVLQSVADRPFFERSWGEQNLTPGEFDLGARAYSNLGKFKVQVAATNGNMVGEKTFSLMPDLNHGKDFWARTNVDFGTFDVGVSGTYGRGTLTDPTTNAFDTYGRYGGNVEVAYHDTLVPSLGATKVFVESTYGRNMDRGVKYAFTTPTLNNVGSTRQLEAAAMARVEQDITKWVTLGARFDTYSPNVELVNDRRDTYGVVSAFHFTKGLQMMVEGDLAFDNVHKEGTSAPHKKIETVSTVLQARF